MMKLDNFIGMMTGHFDNKEQFNMMQATGKIYPYAKHVNTVCNDKINNIPHDFNGKFVVEESYYETNGNRHASPHLFLITENEDGILLSSYEIPEGEDKNTFSYDSMKNVDYSVEVAGALVIKESSSVSFNGNCTSDTGVSGLISALSCCSFPHPAVLIIIVKESPSASKPFTLFFFISVSFLSYQPFTDPTIIP